MTILFHPVEVSDDIAAFEIEGVRKIYKLSEMPDAVSEMKLVCMLPAPTFVSGFDLGEDSYGGGGASQQTAMYTLNYRVFVGEVGSKLGLHSHYQLMTTIWAAVADTLRVNDSTEHAVDLRPLSPGPFGMVPSPDEKQFFGFDLGIRVTELIN